MLVFEHLSLIIVNPDFVTLAMLTWPILRGGAVETVVMFLTMISRSE
jgi:hypothetical protein